jgi:hypothetical protein
MRDVISASEVSLLVWKARVCASVLYTTSLMPSVFHSDSSASHQPTCVIHPHDGWVRGLKAAAGDRNPSREELTPPFRHAAHSIIIVARTEGYTNAAEVCALSIVQRPFAFQTLHVRFAPLEHCTRTSGVAASSTMTLGGRGNVRPMGGLHTHLGCSSIEHDDVGW